MTSAERLIKYQNTKWNKDSKYDFIGDLHFGEGYEKELAKIITLGKIEVKTEKDKWEGSRNIAIELSSRGKLSGLNVTEADWWSQVLTVKGEIRGIIMIPVERLKKIVKHSIHKGNGWMTMGGDGNTSELAIIPLKDLADGI
mgnify:CR=1 FL=1